MSSFLPQHIRVLASYAGQVWHTNVSVLTADQLFGAVDNHGNISLEAIPDAMIMQAETGDPYTLTTIGALGMAYECLL